MSELKPCTKDLTGRVFDRWRVDSFAGYYFSQNIGRTNAKWLCICKCGEEKEVYAYALTTGNSKSCGCLTKDMVSKANFKHGRPLEYMTWRSMRQRCNNINAKHYPSYGGRGIRVCKEWDESYEQFIKDMGPKPGKELSIERVDNDKGYYPDNCIWATPTVQARNKRVRPGSLSGVNGVKPTNSKRWSAYIGANNKSVYLGTFDNLADAIKARKDGEAKYWNTALSNSEEK